MDRPTFETLELDALLKLLARHVQTPLGRSLALSLQPAVDRSAIDRDLDFTGECERFLESGQRFGLAGIDDPGPSLERLRVEGTILEAQQVLELEHLVSVGMSLRDLFREAVERDQYPSLASITGRIPDLRKLLADIRGKVLPGGEIDDNASLELRTVRHSLHSGRARVHRALESILRQQARAVQEDLITFRNGRFVIPIRTDSRVLVPGVVHGLSSSGQTTFVEPLSVIEQNNDLVRLHEQEEIEIARVLLAITEAFRAHQDAIRTIAATVAGIDLGQAKARLASEFDCVRPRLSAGQELVLHEACHILLDQALRQSGGRAVPISLGLDDSHQVLVISGPNAGGKTVVLKTVGLIALMAQMGLYVPAKEAVMPVFERIFADIGDQQSIAANLSTFTAHMRNIAEMSKKVVPRALLLLDEVGTGTDPEEGASLAMAIIDYFRRSGAATLATTHYNPLKMWASQAQGVLNASVEFDESTLRPTYRLIMGIAGASAGLEIARRMEVPEAILEQAQALASPDHRLANEFLKRLKSLVDEQSALSAALEEERSVTASKFARLETEFAERESVRRGEFEKALQKATREFTELSDQLIRGLKDRVAAEKMKKLAQSRTAQLRRAGHEASTRIEAEIALSPPGSGAGKTAAANAAHSSAGEPAEGDRVWVKPLSQAGTIDSVKEETYIVSVGSLKFRARLPDLQLLEAAPHAAVARIPPKPAPDLNLDQTFTPELNVIGLTADEAAQRVDKFLDDAFLSGAENVRIIHGHGKGILRRSIAELLTGHPQVENFQLAPPNQGGAGATIVELRK
jgi:DNA mismatch repair protein MutS2